MLTYKNKKKNLILASLFTTSLVTTIGIPISAYAESASLIIGLAAPNNLYYELESAGANSYLLNTGQPGEMKTYVVGAVVPTRKFGSIYVGNNLQNNNFDLVAMLGANSTNTGGANSANGTPVLNDVREHGVKNLLLGFNNTTSAFYDTTIGQNNLASGGYNFVGGYHNVTGWSYSTAVGTNNNAIGWRSLAIGSDNNTASVNSINVGNSNDAKELNNIYQSTSKAEISTGANTVNIGNKIMNTGINGVGLGNNQQIIAPNAIAIGNNNISGGMNSITIGNTASVIPASGVASSINSNGVINDNEKISNGIAIGYKAIANNSDGIALGSYAINNRNAGVMGYNPSTQQTMTIKELATNNSNNSTDIALLTEANLNSLIQQAETAKANVEAAQKQLADAETAYETNNNMYKPNPALENNVNTAKRNLVEAENNYKNIMDNLAKNVAPWQSQLGALSIGDAANGLTRQITGVAAGSEDTDAVNVAQLKQIKNKIKPLDYININLPTDDNLLPSSLSMFTNTATNSGAQAPGAMALGYGAYTNKSNSLAIGTNAMVVNEMDSVALGYGAKDDGGLKTDTPASFSGDMWKSSYGVVSVGNKAYSLGPLNIAEHYRRIENVSGGINPHDAVNVAQLNALANMVGVTSDDVIKYNQSPTTSIYTQVKNNNQDIVNLEKGWTLATSNLSQGIKASNLVTFNVGDNLNLAQVNNPNGTTLTWSIVPNPTFGGITIKNAAHTLYMNPTQGISAGGLKITNVGDGNIGENSTDAINGSQIYTMKKDLDNKIAALKDSTTSPSPQPPTPPTIIKPVVESNRTVVYTTDKNGNIMEKAQNGKFYPKGTLTNGVAPAGSVGTDPKDVILRLVNGNDSTTDPIILGNVATGVTDYDAVNVKQLNSATSGIATNTTNITTNAGKIKNNSDNINNNSNGIKKNTDKIENNGKLINANSTNITANTQSIGSLKTTIAGNKAEIEKNATGITNNGNAIKQNTTAIAGNKQDISNNADKIASNITNIGKNSSAIKSNTTAIGGINTQISTMKGNIVANTTNITNQGKEISALNKGEAGPVIYTNEENLPVAVAKNGNYYLANQVDNNGNPTSGAQPITTGIRLSLVNNTNNMPNSIGNTIILGNVANAVKGSDAVPLDQLKNMLADKGVTTETNPIVTYDSDKKESITLGGKSNNKLNVPQGVAIHNLANGTATKDAVNYGQLQGMKANIEKYLAEHDNNLNNNLNQRFNDLSDDIAHTGSMAAALAGLSPINYVPGETGQFLANIGNYRGTTAIAIGLARYNTPNLVFKTGIAYGGSNHMMANFGFTWRFGKGLTILPKKHNDVDAILELQENIKNLEGKNSSLTKELNTLKNNYTTILEQNKQLEKELLNIKTKLGIK